MTRSLSRIEASAHPLNHPQQLGDMAPGWKKPRLFNQSTRLRSFPLRIYDWSWPLRWISSISRFYQSPASRLNSPTPPSTQFSRPRKGSYNIGPQTYLGLEWLTRSSADIADQLPPYLWDILWVLYWNDAFMHPLNEPKQIEFWLAWATSWQKLSTFNQCTGLSSFPLRIFNLEVTPVQDWYQFQIMPNYLPPKFFTAIFNPILCAPKIITYTNSIHKELSSTSRCLPGINSLITESGTTRSWHTWRLHPTDWMAQSN